MLGWHPTLAEPGKMATVLTHPTRVSLLLSQAGAGQTPLPSPGRNKPLEGTYWRATELAGKPTPAQDPEREAHLQFQSGRVSGSDGCNRITGSFQLKTDKVTFGQMAGTQMACINTGDTEGPFHDALKNAARLTITNDRLELFDDKGTRLAAFVARAPAQAGARAPGLAGTSWQLVKFQGSDDTTLTPDHPANYTIEFGTGGQFNARFDCNRGRGTWKSSGPSQLEFGPLALTRMMCQPGSLHNQMVRQWGNITSYVIRDGHLFLALKLDSGIYEFEPIKKGK
jgi:heat shock protein HslJ